ncbi:MAG: hypothetical protein QOJ39_3726 [Candidatus Eremiobacteraeota bacterium]|jgi:hypothetical protein|nr:hypothetical protein [Candidatus Eremiobacteraeota bacterium]
MTDAAKFQPLYGVWLHGQVRSVVDQAHQRKGEIPPNQSSDVQEALKHLENALSKLQHHAK